MKRFNYGAYFSVFIFLLSGIAFADEMKKVTSSHAQVWNKFADDILALHQQLIKDKPHIMKTRIGGYSGMKDFYKEESYYEKSNNNLISRIQWELENPKALHTIEVFIRDAQGRVIRDYTAAYLPTYRNAPTQTLVSFHKYNGELHSFRTFDASRARIVERCTGKLAGKEVNMLLDEDEIYAALEGKSNVMERADYKACFGGLSEKPGKHLTPQ